MPRKKKAGNEEWDNGMGYFVKTKSVDVPGKRNVITASFFTFKNAYKPLSFYGDGLLVILDHIEKHNSKNNILLRIYYDFSLEKWGDAKSHVIMKKLKAHPKVELVYCDFRKSVPEEKYNILTMLFRFIPFFDFPWEDADNAFVTDIDLTPHQIKHKSTEYMLETFDKIIDENMTLFLKTPLGYTPFWYKKLSPNKITSMLGYFWGGSLKAPHSIITSFVKSFLTKDDGLVNVYKKNYFDYVTKLNRMIMRDESRKHTASKKKSQHCVSQFDCNYTYGFDEFFINFYVLHWALGNVDDIHVFMTPLAGNVHGVIGKIFEKTPLDAKNRFISQFLTHIKYGESMTFDRFHGLFRKHDWHGTNKKLHKLYCDFHKYVLKNYKSMGNIIDKREVERFQLMDTYLHDKNNLQQLSKGERKKRYNGLSKIISSKRKLK